jgi:sugar phosphate isomerase/epimerase
VRWQDHAVRALEILAGWAGGAEKLAVENLEGYPPDLVTPAVAEAGASRCVDVGHLWVDGYDPLPYLEAALPRTRVVHLHGLAGRDHQSLAHLPPERLDPIIALLLSANYRGVLTLEVFGEDDFQSSVAALNASLGRVTK